MTAIAPTFQGFFTERLTRQLRASPHTVAAYRDTLRLLLVYVHEHGGKHPASLDWADLDAGIISSFLDYIERERGNGVRTRNARLTAVRSLYRYAALRHPEHAALIQRVLAIPPKRSKRALVSFLTRQEVDALIAAPDQATWLGRRDGALLLTAVQTGLRVSELTGLNCGDAQLGTGAHLRCLGKGRKERVTPLTSANASVLRAWFRERGDEPTAPLFCTRQGARLSRDAVEKLLVKHAAAATKGCPSLQHKRVTPHVLRHTTAMQLLGAGVDTSTIALWLGHEQVATTHVYLHADLSLKERALDRIAPHDVAPGRYRPPDALLGFLESL